MAQGLIEGALLQTTEGALNALLARDPVTLQRLAPLAGRCLKVELIPAGPHLYLFPHAGGLLLQQRSEATPDARIRLTYSQLLQLLASSETTAPPAAGSLDLRGDSSLVQTIREILTDLQIDWEGLLADYLGDLPAHGLARAGRTLQNYLQRSSRQAQADLRQYLIDELELLPDRQELEGMADAIDDLRADCDRLEQRITRLRPREP